MDFDKLFQVPENLNFDGFTAEQKKDWGIRMEKAIVEMSAKVELYNELGDDIPEPLQQSCETAEFVLRCLRDHYNCRMGRPVPRHTSKIQKESWDLDKCAANTIALASYLSEKSMQESEGRKKKRDNLLDGSKERKEDTRVEEQIQTNVMATKEDCMVDKEQDQSKKEEEIQTNVMMTNIEDDDSVVEVQEPLGECIHDERADPTFIPSDVEEYMAHISAPKASETLPEKQAGSSPLKIRRGKPKPLSSTEEGDDVDDVDPIISKNPGKKTKCPACGKMLTRVNRHLRETHRWKLSRINQHMIKLRPEKKKNPRKSCPVEGCGWWGAVLGRHLQKEHDISKKSNSTLYCEMLKKATKLKDLLEARKQKRKAKHQSRSSLAQNTTVSSCDLLKDTNASPTISVDQDPEEIIEVTPRSLPERAARASAINVFESENESCSVGDDDMIDVSYDPSKDDDLTSSEEEPPRELIAVQRTSRKLETRETGESSSDTIFEDSISGFLGHVMSPDGGRKNEKIAKQKVQQIIAIANAVSGTGSKTMLQTWGDSDIIWQRFFEEESKKRINWMGARNRDELPKGLSAATLQAYSLTLEEYLNYVFHRLGDQITPKEHSKLNALLKVQGRWRQSLTQDKADQESARRGEERSKQITLDDLAIVMTSDLAKRARARMNFGYKGIISGVEPLYDPSEFSFLRNFLMTTLLYDLAGRASSISGLTVNEFETRRNDGKHTKVTIAKHKTAKKYGPITLCLKPSTAQLMEVYYKLIRSKLPCEATNNSFFLTETGSSVESNQVSNCISSFIRRTNALPDANRNSATSIRKMWVTTGHGDEEGFDEEGRKKLATLMMHNLETATTWYNQNPGRESDASDAALLIQQAQEKAEERVNLETQTSADTSESPSKSGKAKIPGRSTLIQWSSLQNRVLKKEFKTLIFGKNRPIKKDIVDIFLSCTNPEVNAIWTQGNDKKWRGKCIDKIRTLWNSEQAKNKH